jgi:hypothetical protein
MTKKKSLLLQFLFVLAACLTLISVLVLTGCSNHTTDEECTPSPIVREDVPFNGDDYFATSDFANVTNQEVFDKMIASEEGMYTLLNLVDDILLRANFCADSNEVAEFMASFRDQIDDLDTWMMEQGYASEDEIIKIVELNSLRQEVALSTVNVTDEDVQEAFELWFGDDDTDFDEVRDEIYDSLVSQQMGDVEAILAELRDEAGFVIYNEILADAYTNYLVKLSMDTDTDVYEASSGDQTDIIARVGDDEITVGQLFAALTSELGILTTFELVDPMILEDRFEVDSAEVEEIIDELKESYGDEFDSILASEGFKSEDELFQYFEVALLNEAAFKAEFTPTEERLRELHAQMNETISGRHILVDNEELAVDLIGQLQEATDFSELFTELAIEYSSCGSAESGGDLGSWERGRMVTEFDDAIFALEAGEFTTEPVETQHGYHIIYKTSLNDVPDFDDARDELEDEELARLRQSGAMTALLMNLRSEANVTFMNSFLQEQFEMRLAQFE